MTYNIAPSSRFEIEFYIHLLFIKPESFIINSETSVGFIDCAFILPNPTTSASRPGFPELSLSYLDGRKVYEGDSGYSTQFNGPTVTNYPQAKRKFIQTGSNDIISIKFNYRMCEEWEFYLYDNCQIVPMRVQTGDNIDVFALFEVPHYIPSFLMVKIGTATINWDNEYQQIHIDPTVQFPSAHVESLYISGQIGPRYHVTYKYGSLTDNNESIIFVASCDIVQDTIVNGVEWYELITNENICGVGGECYNGHCYCDQFSSFELYEQNRCLVNDITNDLPCSEVITCQDGSTAYRDFYKQCYCECIDSTNPWKDCRVNTIRTTYKPTARIETNTLDYERSYFLGYEQFDYDQDVFIVDFGSLEDIYNAQLHEMEYFTMNFENVPSELLGRNEETYQYHLHPLDLDYQCTWIVKEDNGKWFNENVRPTEDSTVYQSFEGSSAIPQSAANHPDVFQSFRNIGYTLFELSSNPFYQFPQPPQTQQHLHLFKHCYYNPLKSIIHQQPEIYKNPSITITGFSRMLHYKWSNISIQDALIRPFVVPTTLTTTDVRVQLNPNEFGFRLLWDGELNTPPSSSYELEIEYMSYDFSCNVMYAQCTISQNGIYFGQTAPESYWVLMPILPATFTTEPVQLNCQWNFICDGGDYETTEEFYTALTQDYYDLSIFDNGYDAEDRDSTLYDTLSFPEEPTELIQDQDVITIGDELVFDFTDYMYHLEGGFPSFHHKTSGKVIMHYPQESNLGSIEIGNAYIASGFVRVYVTSNELKYWNQNGLTFELILTGKERADGLRKISLLRLLSHFNPVIYPSCQKQIDMKIGTVATFEDLCPGTSTCSITTNSCLCEDSTTDCICTATPSTPIWNGQQCAPQCPNQQVWDGTQCTVCGDHQNKVGQQCINKCSFEQEWNNNESKCVSKCSKSSQIWNGSRCVNRCKIDEQWYDETNECITECTIAQLWNGTECIERCEFVHQTWDIITQQCIERCPSIIQAWDVFNKVCTTFCPDVQDIWDYTTQKCIKRCPIGGEFFNGNECTTSCPECEDFKCGTKCGEIGQCGIKYTSAIDIIPITIILDNSFCAADTTSCSCNTMCTIGAEWAEYGLIPGRMACDDIFPTCSDLPIDYDNIEFDCQFQFDNSPADCDIEGGGIILPVFVPKCNMYCIDAADETLYAEVSQLGYNILSDPQFVNNNAGGMCNFNYHRPQETYCDEWTPTTTVRKHFCFNENGITITCPAGVTDSKTYPAIPNGCTTLCTSSETPLYNIDGTETELNEDIQICTEDSFRTKDDCIVEENARRTYCAYKSGSKYIISTQTDCDGTTTLTTIGMKDNCHAGCVPKDVSWEDAQIASSCKTMVLRSSQMFYL